MSQDEVVEILEFLSIILIDPVVKAPCALLRQYGIIHEDARLLSGYISKDDLTDKGLRLASEIENIISQLES